MHEQLSNNNSRIQDPHSPRKQDPYSHIGSRIWIHLEDPGPIIVVAGSGLALCFSLLGFSSCRGFTRLLLIDGGMGARTFRQ